MKNKLLIGGLLTFLSVLFLLILIPFDPPKWTELEIHSKVLIIYELSAIGSPHLELDPKSIRKQNIVVFNKVEKGQVLNENESRSYRVAYQYKLSLNQKLLSFFDNNLTLMNNLGMNKHNNVNTLGIEGRHDHHDASVRANMEEIKSDINKVQDKHSGFITKILSSIKCYKNASDILQHLATVPQTKSIHYTASRRDQHFPQQSVETTMYHFKNAQFHPINSSKYWDELNKGVNSYTKLISTIQQTIYNNTTPLQRTIIGRWTSWKSLGPSLDGQFTERYYNSVLKKLGYRE